MYTTLISVENLTKILDQENLVIIDCRMSLGDPEGGRKEYKIAHIPKALYAHLDEDLSGQIIPGKTGRHPFPRVPDMALKLSNWGIDNDTQVVVYDQSHGGIAARLWFLLNWLGHEKVAVLDGGWKHWVESGGSKTAEPSVSKTKIFVPKPRPELVKDVEFMEQNIDNEDFIYIDSRAAVRYRGEEEPIDPIAGHIPNAISAPFLDNLGPDGLFLSKEDLAKRFLKILEGQPKGRAIFYCGSGVTACHNLLAMYHLGLKSPKLYPGSWSEWIIDSNQKIEKK